MLVLAFMEYSRALLYPLHFEEGLIWDENQGESSFGIRQSLGLEP